MSEVEEQKELSKVKYDPSILPDILPLYYKRIFPHKPFFRWLSYGQSESSIFTNREISFALADDIIIRYLSFENQAELEKEICTKNPAKIDIGPVMSLRPKYQRTNPNVKPVQRELVFDIDMTDYDDVRTCCKEAEVCNKCWKFMTIACRILDTALRDDFGFQHILWVFSGRRGIHCWVCDEVARRLDTKGRSAIAEYLQVVTIVGDTRGARVVINDKMHHSVKRAYKIIEPMFEEVILVDQDLFSTPDGLALLIGKVPDESTRKDLEPYLKKHEGNSKAIWDAFVRYFASIRVQNGQGLRKLKNVVEEVQMAMMYPRLDINVTKGFNHLLKAPFCVHPKTGKVCVPFNPAAAAKFDLTTVPTISSLVDEISKYDKDNAPDENDGKRRIKDYKKTGIFKGIQIFEEFVRKLESTFKVKAIDVSDATMEY